MFAFPYLTPTEPDSYVQHPVNTATKKKEKKKKIGWIKRFG